MELKQIDYRTLKPRQQEIYNFQKVAALLADYGFNCIKLSDDWLGADFLAYHKDGRDTLKVQLKSRLTIDKKYSESGLHVAFPLKGKWYLVEHDELVRLIGEHSNWLNTKSWTENGIYHSDAPNGKLIMSLKRYVLDPKAL
jgi:hypothetical protein